MTRHTYALKRTPTILQRILRVVAKITKRKKIDYWSEYFPFEIFFSTEKKQLMPGELVFVPYRARFNLFKTFDLWHHHNFEWWRRSSWKWCFFKFFCRYFLVHESETEFFEQWSQNNWATAYWKFVCYHCFELEIIFPIQKLPQCCIGTEYGFNIVKVKWRKFGHCFRPIVLPQVFEEFVRQHGAIYTAADILSNFRLIY